MINDVKRSPQNKSFKKRCFHFKVNIIPRHWKEKQFLKVLFGSLPIYYSGRFFIPLKFALGFFCFCFLLPKASILSKTDHFSFATYPLEPPCRQMKFSMVLIAYISSFSYKMGLKLNLLDKVGQFLNKIIDCKPVKNEMFHLFFIYCFKSSILLVFLVIL